MRKLLMGFVFGTAISIASATGDAGSRPLLEFRDSGRFGGGSTSNITVRDYFAAQALVGICNTNAYRVDVNEIAKRAYAIADAMLAAREAQGK